MPFKNLQFLQNQNANPEEIKELCNRTSEYRTLLKQNIVKIATDDIIRLAEIASRMNSNDRQDFERIMGSSDTVLQQYRGNVLKLDELDQLVFDENIIKSSTQQELIDYLKPGINRLLKCYNIDTDLNNNELKATLQFDATYLNAYVKRLKSGKLSGASEVKPNCKRSSKPKIKVLKNVFIFAISYAVTLLMLPQLFYFINYFIQSYMFGIYFNINHFTNIIDQNFFQPIDKLKIKFGIIGNIRPALLFCDICVKYYIIVNMFSITPNCKIIIWLYYSGMEITLKIGICNCQAEMGVKQNKSSLFQE
ncbi:Hypothetical_protein [Hexamita inflata]|uniref:Hypothetical_protein n=1 Tax=Hexamita inflata TaxID=28002 RepID=A0AA86PR12_9EUKA|nr:Hypothetical protein HINF_LOCUS30342 [Hexamita inflata]